MQSPSNNMSGQKILIFLGSARLGRMGERVAKFVQNTVEANGMTPILFDPLEMPFEILRQPLHFMPNPEEAPDWMKEANEKIKSADGLIIISAEYNCGIPPALSNMMNHFPPASFRHKPCGIVTYSMGIYGGVRAGAFIRPFASELGIVTIPSYVGIPQVQDNFDADGTSKTERVANNIVKLVNEVGWYSKALGSYKTENPPPS